MIINQNQEIIKERNNLESKHAKENESILYITSFFVLAASACSGKVVDPPKYNFEIILYILISLDCYHSIF